MNIRKLLSEDMSNAARKRRIDRYRQKLAPESAVESMVDSDEAIENASLPSEASIKAKMSAKPMDVSDVAGDDWSKQNADALASLEEDEEDAKWMAKQKG